MTGSVSAPLESPPGDQTAPPLIIHASSALRPAAWLVAAYTLMTTLSDPDLWGHVRFGQDLLRDRALTSIDPYSFTQDRPWINHEWLSELLMGAAFNTGGSLGLILLRVGLAAAALAVIWRSARHATLPWRWGTALFVTAVIMPIQTTVRPQLWTILLLAILCHCLVMNDRRQWAIPLIFVLWANMHGGWIVGLGVLGAWTAGQLFERRLTGRLALVCALSIAATLVTPYGIELWRFIASTVRLERSDITEWQPVWTDGGALAMWGFIAAYIAVVWRKTGRPSLAAILILMMMGFASARVVRLLGLFAICAVMLLARRLPRASTQTQPARAQTLVEVAMCGVAIVLMTQIGSGPACINMEPGRPPDPPVFAALIDAQLQGRMVNPFDWGEAALARMGPALKVSIDGRRETVYSDATVREQGAIQSGSPTGLEALARLAPDYVWLPLPFSRPTYEWLKGNGYRIDLETDKSFVAVRNGLPRISPAVSVPRLCYPFRNPA